MSSVLYNIYMCFMCHKGTTIFDTDDRTFYNLSYSILQILCVTHNAHFNICLFTCKWVLCMYIYILHNLYQKFNYSVSLSVLIKSFQRHCWGSLKFQSRALWNRFSCEWSMVFTELWIKVTLSLDSAHKHAIPYRHAWWLARFRDLLVQFHRNDKMQVNVKLNS